ncbi:hypothetical protein P3342_005937 [Pyrenophora teres f. teres]|nr:hypothetical protein P3342_005937 [Pyrenophora teres f. teres]
MSNVHLLPYPSSIHEEKSECSRNSRCFSHIQQFVHAHISHPRLRLRLRLRPMNPQFSHINYSNYRVTDRPTTVLTTTPNYHAQLPVTPNQSPALTSKAQQKINLQ